MSSNAPASGRIAILHPNLERGEALARILRFAGYQQLLVAGTGLATAPKVLGFSPDLVIGTLAFEEPPLLTLLSRLRAALGRELPLLLLLGREDVAVPGDVDEVVREPADARELATRVAAVLRTRAERHQLQRKLDELLGLYRVSWAFSLAGGAEALYGHLAHQSAELLRAQKGLLLLYDAKRREMLAQAPAYGLTRQQVARVRYAVDGEPRSRWNFRTNGALMSNHARQDARLLPTLTAELELDSLVIVPLLRGPRIMGLLLAGNRPARPFSEDDLRLLQAVAGQAGVAVENQRLHEELKAANAQLQELDQLKSEFVTMVAHDFRSPLMAIRGFAELVLEDSEIGPENRRELMRTIISQTEDLARLAEDTFLITQLEKRQFTYRWSELDLGPFVLDAVTRARTEHPVAIDVPAGLPRVVADPERIRQVLTNLVSNAVKYSQPDGSITIRCRDKQPAEVVVEVIDSGFGIPPDQIGRLFQKFERVRSERHARVSGTGLGLYICRLIVEAHGGRIWAESEVGKGSTFAFALPLRPDAAAPGEPRDTPAAEGIRPGGPGRAAD